MQLIGQIETMQTLLLESPVTLAVIGFAVAALAVIAWTQVGDVNTQRIALGTAVATCLSTAILVVVSVQVQTDRERIAATLYEVARALRTNDLETVYSYIHPNAVEGMQRAKNELPRYEFNDARVTRIKQIEVNDSTKPRTAIAEFNVVVDVNLSANRGRAARFVRVYFMERGDRWLARDYEHLEPTAGFRSTD